MAAPPSKILQSLSGKWKLNKELSGDFTSVLVLQGVNALIRQASSAASVHLTITQPSQDQVNMKQTATAAAIPGATEAYTLDWQWRSNHDALFGDVEGRSRWISVGDARREGGQGEWIRGDSEEKLINAEGKKPDGAWEATHLWGFEVVGGDRRHTRRVKVVIKEGEELRARMVYDFEGDN